MEVTFVFRHCFNSRRDRNEEMYSTKTHANFKEEIRHWGMEGLALETIIMSQRKKVIFTTVLGFS